MKMMRKRTETAQSKWQQGGHVHVVQHPKVALDCILRHHESQKVLSNKILAYRTENVIVMEHSNYHGYVLKINVVILS